MSDEAQMNAEVMQDLAAITSDSDSTTDDEVTEVIEESVEDENEDTNSEESEPTEEASEEEEEDSDEVKFDFRETPTSIQNLVAKLSNLSESERTERISKLTRDKEISAVKEAFPDNFREEVTVGKKEIDELRAEIASLKDLGDLRETRELLEQSKILRPNIERELRNRMLQDQFGDNYKDVTKDVKFIEAFDKYSTLDLEERLELACTLSPVARKFSMSKDVKKAARTLAATTVKAGQTVKSAPKEMSAEELMTPEGLEKALAHLG